MKDFIFRNDTKLFFRNDIRETILEIVKGHKVMFVYGNGSVKQNGCHADIVQTLTEAGISFVEYGGSSREFAKIEEGIRFAKANGVTMIIGAGGASVMDSAKLIAFGFYHEADLWDYLKGKSPYGQERLPLALIPTYPSSGSENGLGAVSVDSRTGDFGTAYGIPADYALLCPNYSLTLDKEMTTYTGLVTLVQLTACILGDKNKMSYDAGISYVRNVLEATRTLRQHPDDLDARGTILMGLHSPPLPVWALARKNRLHTRYTNWSSCPKCCSAVPIAAASLQSSLDSCKRWESTMRKRFGTTTGMLSASRVLWKILPKS